MTRRILFVAMQDSPHTVRWIEQIAEQGWDLHLFPVNYLPVLPEMRGVTVHQPWYMVRLRLMLRKLLSGPSGWRESRPGLEADLYPNRPPVRSIYPLPMVPPLARILNDVIRVRLGESDAQAPLVYGPHVLARLIRQIKPDLIHSMEFQHCGYNVLRSKEISDGNFPPWLATNWGSDIYYYRNFDDHRSQISRLLRNIDYYSCECVRDVGIARELGLTAKVMPAMPNAGGFHLEQVGQMRKTHLPSTRRLIMVKGYQHFAGRALTALDAIERCVSALKGFRIVVFSASSEIYERVEELRASLGLDISVLPYSNHDKMLRLFSRARVYLGVSISDGISTSMLEAMTMGAFPIQTSTACCDEWIEDGRSGFIIPPDKVGLIADRLRQALTDDPLVDNAAEINWTVVRERLDQKVLRNKVVAFYDEIFAELEGRKK